MLTDRDKFQKAVIFMSIREPGSGLGGPPQQGFFEHVLIFLVFYSYVIGMSKYCEGVVYTYGDYQAEVRGPRARFTEPCSRCGVQGVVSHVGFIEPEL